jgi:cell division septation protein DedD
MDNALKQRILGIIVLFALIGICISVLLHNNKVEREQGIQRAHQLIAQQQQQATQKTPLTTQVQMTAVAQPTTTTAQPQQTEVAPTTPSTTSVFNTTAPPTTSTPSPTTTKKITKTTTPSTTSTMNNFSPPVTTTHPAITKTTKTKATTTVTTEKTFIVQVGTFSKKSNATALVKALHERGFNATTVSTKTTHGILTKVLVGGEKGLTKAEAETAKLRLKKTLDLNGVISPISTASTHHNTKKSTVAKKKITAHHETKSTNTSTTESAVSQKDSGAVVIP